MGPKWDALMAQRVEEARIRARITRHYARFKSFSRVARERLIERDVRAALLAAGLPVRQPVDKQEQLRRAVHMVRRDPTWIKMLPPEVRPAVRAALETGRD